MRKTFALGLLASLLVIMRLSLKIVPFVVGWNVTSIVSYFKAAMVSDVRLTVNAGLEAVILLTIKELSIPSL